MISSFAQILVSASGLYSTNNSKGKNQMNALWDGYLGTKQSEQEHTEKLSYNDIQDLSIRGGTKGYHPLWPFVSGWGSFHCKEMRQWVRAKGPQFQEQQLSTLWVTRRTHNQSSPGPPGHVACNRGCCFTSRREMILFPSWYSQNRVCKWGTVWKRRHLLVHLLPWEKVAPSFSPPRLHRYWKLNVYNLTDPKRLHGQRVHHLKPINSVNSTRKSISLKENHIASLTWWLSGLILTWQTLGSHKSVGSCISEPVKIFLPFSR